MKGGGKEKEKGKTFFYSYQIGNRKRRGRAVHVSRKGRRKKGGSYSPSSLFSRRKRRKEGEKEARELESEKEAKRKGGEASSFRKKGSASPNLEGEACRGGPSLFFLGREKEKTL